MKFENYTQNMGEQNTFFNILRILFKNKKIKSLNYVAQYMAKLELSKRFAVYNYLQL